MEHGFSKRAFVWSSRNICLLGLLLRMHTLTERQDVFVCIVVGGGADWLAAIYVFSIDIRMLQVSKSFADP